MRYKYNEQSQDGILSQPSLPLYVPCLLLESVIGPVIETRDANRPFQRSSLMKVLPDQPFDTLFGIYDAAGRCVGMVQVPNGYCIQEM